MPTLPNFSLKFDEHQLFDLAVKARVRGVKRGYLHKAADAKLKKLVPRWCCLFQNFLFYYESESVTKPTGVVFVEGTVCKPVDQLGRDVESTFRISPNVPDGCNSKHHFFVAPSDKERDGWMEAISNANMTKLLHEVEGLRERCLQLEGKLATSEREVQHLKLANQYASDDIVHLRHTLTCSSPRRRSSANPFSPIQEAPSKQDQQARVLQGYIRGWLIRRRWKKLVRQYMESPLTALLKKRNQLIWKFVASEEDYVSQLTVLNEEYRQQCEIAACSTRPFISLEQCNALFRNSEELLLFHQLFLRGLHSRIEKWPVVVFGDVLRLFVPMMAIYHHYVGNNTHALDLLFGLKSEPRFKAFVENMQSKANKRMVMEELLVAPLKRISLYIQDLQELRALTPTEHVDYPILDNTISELEIIQKTVSDEVCQSANIRQVLKVEHLIEGGCEVLLDREQTLVRRGALHQVRLEDSKTAPPRGSKLRTSPRYCFLFSKHLLIATRSERKESYRLCKDGILPLSKCHIHEMPGSEFPDIQYRGIRVDCWTQQEMESSVILLANGIDDKAQWLADFTQCVENERQNKILQSQSLGEPVELSSRFIRYSTFKTGKEQLVNCGDLESLLQRLAKVNHFGLDFLNTFLMTFPLYTSAHAVMDFLEESFHECLGRRERKRSGSITPQDAVRDARAISSPSLPRCTTHSVTVTGNFLTVPHQNGATGGGGGAAVSGVHNRTASQSAIETSASVSGVFFALKHWICKHFHHFREDPSLSAKVEGMLQYACSYAMLSTNEKKAVMEVHRMYYMQKEAKQEESPVLDIMQCASIILPQKPFEVVLLWQPRETAEQLCYIESTLFSRIGNSEILRYFMSKGAAKAKAAPNLTAIFDHFNRMSLFFMWSVACQRYLIDRTKVLEFLIQVAGECAQLNNFSSLMQLMSALEHGSVSKFKISWEHVQKHLKLQLRSLSRLSSTDGRFKELRMATKKAQPPVVPYLGILLNEMAGVVEATPTLLEDNLINFTKMRRCTNLITSALQYRKESFDFPFVPEISKVLLCTTIPGNEDDLYQFVADIEDK